MPEIVGSTDFTAAELALLHLAAYKEGSPNSFGNLPGDVLAGLLGGSLGYNAQTDNYTLALTDVGKLIGMNKATAVTLTVPPNSSVAFPIGTTTIDIGQYGAGQVTITPGSGVTIRSSGAKLKLTGQYSGATLQKIGTDEWWAFGDLSA